MKKNIFAVCDLEAEYACNFMDYLNPNSMVVKKGCKANPNMRDAKGGDTFQFLRTGYFCVDSRYSTPEHPVFNQTVSLKDSYKPEQK